MTLFTTKKSALSIAAALGIESNWDLSVNSVEIPPECYSSFTTPKPYAADPRQKALMKQYVAEGRVIPPTVTGTLWWNNGSVNKRTAERPGPEWVQGRVNFKKRSGWKMTKERADKGKKRAKPYQKKSQAPSQ